MNTLFNLSSFPLFHKQKCCLWPIASGRDEVVFVYEFLPQVWEKKGNNCLLLENYELPPRATTYQCRASFRGPVCTWLTKALRGSFSRGCAVACASWVVLKLSLHQVIQTFTQRILKDISRSGIWMHTLVHVRQLPLLHILTYDNGGPLTILVTLECLEHNTLYVEWMFGLCNTCFHGQLFSSIYLAHTLHSSRETPHVSQTPADLRSLSARNSSH